MSKNIYLTIIRDVIITCNSKSLKLSYQSTVGKFDSESSNMSNP